MKNSIRCDNCYMMVITGRARITEKNSHLSRPRGSCVCKHPEANAAFQLICPKSSRMATFIAFTKGDSDEPDIKTAPRWCPRELCEEPYLVTQAEAEEIIETRHPRGIFYQHVNDTFIGIDNRTGHAWTEEFTDKTCCFEWLRGEFEANCGKENEP